jgi:PAS domain S-box-containing protein
VTPSELQRVFRFAPGRVLVLRPDAAFTILAASVDYLRTTHTDASIFGRPLFEVFPDNPATGADGARRLSESLRRVIATRAPDAMPPTRYDVHAPDGSFEERHWLPVNSPVLAEDGSVDYILHAVDDASTAASRDAVRILESITEGFFTLDRQWRFDYANAEAHRILDRTPGDLRGKVLWEAYPGLEGTEFERAYVRAMVDRQKTSFTAFYAARNAWFEVTAFPAPEGISIYFRDVSDAKRIEQERERLIVASERQRRIYETALDSTPDFVYVFDLQHRALYANAALMKVWGVDDVRGKTWMDLGYEQWHADMHDREIDQVIATRAPIRGEIPFTGTNGRRIYDYIFAPVLDAQGEVVAVAGTTRDVTERQAAEQAIRDQAARLTEADRAKDEFLATLAHELRNPLAPLRNSIELMKRSAAMETDPERLRVVMERQVDQLVRLVDDLLEVSRINSAKVELRIGKVALGSAVRDAIDATRPIIEEAGQELVVDMPDAPLFLDGDETRLTQILVNLLNNAAKYTGRGGRIVVRGERDGDHAVVRVRDNGVGISPAAIPHIFEMFNRGDRDSNRNQAGLGIGLALSRQLAGLHGGTLEATSAGLGMGSEFVLRVPLSASQAPVAPKPVLQDVDLRVQRVLVVDDNVDAGDTLATLLRVLGAEVHVARDGMQALSALDTFLPSVAILDIGMPEMNGYEVARAIRGRLSDAPIMLVALTGWAQDADRRRALEAGFDHHMVKPPNLDALQRLLAAS